MTILDEPSPINPESVARRSGVGRAFDDFQLSAISMSLRPSLVSSSNWRVSREYDHQKNSYVISGGSRQWRTSCFKGLEDGDLNNADARSSDRRGGNLDVSDHRSIDCQEVSSSAARLSTLIDDFRFRPLLVMTALAMPDESEVDWR